MTTIRLSESQQTIAFLNQQFGNKRISFIEVAPGLVKAVLSFWEQAGAEVHLQGAHLTRWLDKSGRDNIFTSQSAVYESGTPIRGGNPIIFPQFGPGEICQHGFARNSAWQVVDTEITANATALSLQLKPENITENYRNQWPHDFVLTLVISIGETLVTQMKVQNPNNYPISFTLGFHTYLAVDNINSTEISGFSNLEYMDNLRDRAVFSESREVITISEFTDRRYQNIPSSLTIHDRSTGRLIEMQTKNCHDAFVWNPWQEAGQKLADLEPHAYQKFVCVEPGNMKTAIIVAPGQEFVSEQQLKRVD